MQRTPYLASSDAESFSLKLGVLWSYFTITGNTTDALSAATTANPAFKIFIEEGVDSGAPDTVDAGNTLATLDDDANPAIVGFIGVVGDAAEMYCVETGILSGDGTAFTPTKAGVSLSGVTLLKNLAYTQSMAGVDIDANTNVQTFTQKLFYRKV